MRPAKAPSRSWLLAAVIVFVHGSSSTRLSAQADVPPQLLALAEQSSVRVLIQVSEPSRPAASEAVDTAWRARMQLAQERVQRSLANAGRSRRFTRLPWIQAAVSRDDLLRLSRDPQVVSIAPDMAMRPALRESSATVRAPVLWGFGYTGHAWSVAILDSGVDSTHPFLAGRVSAQACYSSTVPADATSSLCLGGGPDSLAPGSGEPCRFNALECAHGTHLAGIAAGSVPAAAGIARGSSVISVQVYSRSDSRTLCSPSPTPCLVSYMSDQIRALEHVRDLAGPDNINRVASANLSLSLGAYAAACDTVGGMGAIKAAVDQLRQIGIATVAASGNEGSSTSLGAPACISSVISVGSTFDTVDVLSSFTNRSPLLSLLAPGSGITSSVPGGAYVTASGTSMATPHVAGAWALLKHLVPGASVTDILSALRSTGAAVQDRAGVFRRIDIEAAGRALIAGTLRPPGAPESIVATVAGSRLTLGWTPPRSGPGATSYRVIVSDEQSTTIASIFDVGQTLLVSGDLAPRARPYLVRVLAMNPAGLGTVSAGVLVSIPLPPPPLAPTGVSVTVIASAVTLSWTAAAGASSYVLEVGSAAGQADLAVFETNSPLTTAATGMVPAGTYYVRVRGRNAGGVSPPSLEIVAGVPR